MDGSLGTHIGYVDGMAPGLEDHVPNTKQRVFTPLP